MASDVSRRQARARGRNATGLIGVLLVAFGALAAIVRADRSGKVDVAITLWLQRWRWPWLRRLMTLVSWPGFSPQSRLIPVLIAGLYWRLGRPAEARFTLLAWGVSALSATTKRVVQRPRPAHAGLTVVPAHLDGYSFPSGHVLAYVSVYGFQIYCALRFVRPTALRRAIVAALGVLIASVGPSRVYQGHHWPTDVVASYLLGFGYVLGVTRLYRQSRTRQVPYPPFFPSRR